MIAAWLRRLADWLDPPAVVVPEPLDLLMSRAVALTLEQENRWPERDGESKRHQVYAQLRKDFPGWSKRVLSRAIEDALDQ